MLYILIVCLNILNLNKLNLKKIEKKRQIMYKELNEEIRNLKSDLINNKVPDSSKEYHNWINKNNKFLYPDKIIKSIAYDVKIHPEKNLIHSFLYYF